MSTPNMHDAWLAGEVDSEVTTQTIGEHVRVTGKCGCCGKTAHAGALVDVRNHMLNALRPFRFMCDGCWSVLIRPSKKYQARGMKPIPKAAFVRGFPGEATTKMAHELRRRARDNTDANIDLDHIP